MSQKLNWPSSEPLARYTSPEFLLPVINVKAVIELACPNKLNRSNPFEAKLKPEN